MKKKIRRYLQLPKHIVEFHYLLLVHVSSMWVWVNICFVRLIKFFFIRTKKKKSSYSSLIDLNKKYSTINVKVRRKRKSDVKRTVSDGSNVYYLVFLNFGRKIRKGKNETHCLLRLKWISCIKWSQRVRLFRLFSIFTL